MHTCDDLAHAQGRERRCSIYVRVSSFLLVSAIVVGVTGNWYILVIDIFVIYHLPLSLSLGCNTVASRAVLNPSLPIYFSLA